ncbi:MAG: SAM-dependent chlorinase/fluorinase [Gammaproteobacteria bacterium]|nr:SAM-dependent chlorinase/fluorinase [Gammaproteobacteria bacterium]MCP5423810.1 SAM-dependent chlorinase/fluorinase [Gammaproteobacteria bacterium]
MLGLFTDFGLHGPYTGLLKLALAKWAPGVPVIDLFHDVPPFESQAAAYLLAAYVPEFPKGTVFLGVVDPGVGSARDGLIVHADDYWLVGPDNGLFDRVAARAGRFEAWRITWHPPRLSASFHGRDLFAPVAGMLATQPSIADALGQRIELKLHDWPKELPRIIYIDHYGNAMTGIRAQAIPQAAQLIIDGQDLRWSRTFAQVPVGQGFWYENSSGLVEIAVNQGSAAKCFDLRVGSGIQIMTESIG